MKRKFEHYINFLAVLVAITSFIIGTICLLLFKTSNDTGLIGIGYCYTLFAALVNSIMLLLVIINGITHIKDYKEHLKTTLIVLINIPITLLYIDIVI